jgi:hypothetical protein
VAASGRLTAFGLLPPHLRVAFRRLGRLPGLLVVVVHLLLVTVAGAPRQGADSSLRTLQPTLLLHCLGRASPLVLALFPCTNPALPARPWALLCNPRLDLCSTPTRGTDAVGPGWTLPQRK